MGKTREESATIPQAQNSIRLCLHKREHSAGKQAGNLCNKCQKIAMTWTSMPTMCLNLVSEKGLAHTPECPLPVDATATTTTSGVGFINASDPLDGMLG
jgi:hypothetical protein